MFFLYHPVEPLSVEIAVIIFLLVQLCVNNGILLFLFYVLIRYDSFDAIILNRGKNCQLYLVRSIIGAGNNTEGIGKYRKYLALNYSRTFISAIIAINIH